MGRPRLSIHEMLFCAIQKVYSQLSSRRAYSLFQNATGKGQISHPLHFNTPSKLFNKPELTPILYKLIMHSALPVAGLERKKMYHYFQLNRDDFMEHYHKRSNIEATNAAIKRKFGYLEIQESNCTGKRTIGENCGLQPDGGDP